MAKTYNVLVIEVKEPISDLITAKQGDTNSRFLDVYLKDNGRPINLTGNEVKIYGKKQDGKVIFNNGEITDAVNGRCQFELTSQALAVAGELKLEISIWQNNERTLTTQTFKVLVVPSVRSAEAVESSNEFGALLLLFQNLNDFIQDASYIIERIGVTTDTGGTTTAGTVMAKLNSLLTNWTSARAVKIDNINDAIGKTNDTGGTTIAGTVMAKLNKLLSDWTNARATKIDNIGETTDTNGTATTGTVMAKLNKLLTDWTSTRASYITNLNSRLTSTRAGYLDKLANIGATGDTGGSATAGTIMAKLNKLLTDITTNTGTENIDNNIGKTNDTGGTSTAGTVMAKLNKLLTDWTTTRAGYLTNLNTRLTSTRAGYLDKLANFGATGDTGGTATAGTLMAKVNALLSTGGSAGLKVKSVQHGYVEDGSYPSSSGTNPEVDANQYRKIKINTVNVSKSILLSSSEISTYEGYNTFNKVPTLNSTYLLQPYYRTYSTNKRIYTGFSWAVIEFQ